MASPSTTEYALCLQRQRSSPLFKKESGIFSALFSSKELIIADDDEKTDGTTDGDESRAVGDDLLGFGEIEVAPHIGQSEGENQENVHGPVHAVEVGPAENQYGNCEDGDAEEEVVIPHGSFRDHLLGFLGKNLLS